MPDLIAQGAEKEQRWRRSLAEADRFDIGRRAGAWSTAWDERISRRHAALCWRGGELEVLQLPEARNPIYYRGRKSTHFTLKPGEYFVIGGTTFSVVDDKVLVSLEHPQPFTEKHFDRAELRRAAFRNPDQRIAALARLPDIISTSATDAELYSRLVSVLLAGITAAKGVALVRRTADSQEIEVLHWDHRSLTGDNFFPSQRLIHQSLNAATSIVHVWNQTTEPTAKFTQQANIDWAFSTPLVGPRCQGYALYAAGSNSAALSASDPEALRDDLKFAELVATTFSRLREAQHAERRLAGLSTFLSPVVLAMLAESDVETVLAPREAELTVLFCDLRGFSRLAEKSAHNLFELLERVSLALGVMTRHILAQGGVIGDFHGDAAMGFWGWPLAQDDAAARACRAALAIREEFAAAAQDSGHRTLADFRIGIGIATGRAVAGKIGTSDQVKVTAFGPVVNLASRLESLTKTVQAPILLEERTAAALQAAEFSAGRLRPVARVCPWGMATPVALSELLPHSQHAGDLHAAQLSNYATALAKFHHRDWSAARAELEPLRAGDPVAAFLWQYMEQFQFQAPADWPGFIAMREK
jgi:adenylate cyclase